MLPQFRKTETAML